MYMGVCVHVAVRMILNMDWMLFLFLSGKAETRNADS